MSSAAAVEQAEGGSRRGALRLRPRTRKTLLTVHIVASVALLGEVWGLVVLNLYATLTSDTGLAHAAYRLMTVMIFAGGIPLSLLSLATGVVLAVRSHWGLLRHAWVFAKLVMLIAVILIGMLLFRPEDAAAAYAEYERGTGGLPSSAAAWRGTVAVGTQLALLITATALSVFKPRRELRRRRSANEARPAR